MLPKYLRLPLRSDPSFFRRAERRIFPFFITYNLSLENNGYAIVVPKTVVKTAAKRVALKRLLKNILADIVKDGKKPSSSAVFVTRLGILKASTEEIKTSLKTIAANLDK